MSPALAVAFDEFVADVAAAQAAYHAAHGRYWQGGLTAGGAEVAVAGLPSYAEVGLAPPVGLTVRVDDYGSDEGDGYVVLGFYDDDGTELVRSVNVGPATWRTAEGEVE